MLSGMHCSDESALNASRPTRWKSSPNCMPRCSSSSSTGWRSPSRTSAGTAAWSVRKTSGSLPRLTCSSRWVVAASASGVCSTRTVTFGCSRVYAVATFLYAATVSGAPYTEKRSETGPVSDDVADAGEVAAEAGDAAPPDPPPVHPASSPAETSRAARPAGPRREDTRTPSATRWGDLHTVYGPASGCPGPWPTDGPPAHCWSSRRRSSASRVSSTALTESATDSGRLAPGIGITVGDCASSQARQTCCGLTPYLSAISAKGANLVPSADASDMPPSGLQGRNAMPSDAHSSSSGCELRNDGEYW